MGLYFKQANTGINQLFLVAATGGQGALKSNVFDFSLNQIINGEDYSYIVQRSESDAFRGGTNMTFSGGKWLSTDASGQIGYKNALTIRQGNLSVVSLSGEDFKVLNSVTAVVC